MSQAIVTRYIGATNSRGSRISVRAQAGRMLIPWDHELGIEENHLAAATAFATKYQWLLSATLVGGALPNDTGYAFVLIPKRRRK